MSFLYVAALAVGLLGIGPLVAHLLRRRNADVRDFPAAHLVPPSPPLARQRHRIDDRPLYAVRTLSILLLAALGAVPFVSCSGLSLGRKDGASVALAIVLDDSLSMQVVSEGKTRWERARKAALELVSDAREGDAIAIVLAGAPARVALASTTDLRAARSALEALGPTHRATDLDGALALSRALVRNLPQPDHRIVLLSDLADGRKEASPIGEGDEIPVWVPLEELTTPAQNCAVIRADRQRERVLVRVACSSEEAAAGRSVELRQGEQVLGQVALPASKQADLVIDAKEAPSALVTALTGSDAIEADDRAPVLESSSALGIAVVVDPSASRAVTGGPPLIEQALDALGLDAEIRPLPLLPDRVNELAPHGALILDDPPGFTPEARRALTSWLERGGVLLVTLGPRAALAPLGSSFEPFMSGRVTWGPSPSRGLEMSSANALFGEAAEGLQDLAPHKRATVDASAATEPAKVMARWEDGSPWLIERPLGRGVAYVLTLPTSPDESDLALRPAFLGLLERVVDSAKARTGASRTVVGQPWIFEGARSLEVMGPAGAPISASEEATRKVVTPELVGSYEATLDGEKLVRIAAVPEREVDLRPREVAEAARSTSLGEVRAKIDISPWLATMLLGLMVAELGLRLRASRSTDS